MKKIIIALSLTIFLVSQADAGNFKYGLYKKNGEVVSRICIANDSQAPEQAECTFEECTKAQFESAILKQSSKLILNLDAVDVWLDDQFGGTPLESFAAIVFRATAKDTVDGYDLMVKKANDSGIDQSVIDAVCAKLDELGANI